MEIKKFGIIISKKILKKKDIKLVENFYKTKQVWDFVKIFYKIKCSYIFSNHKNIRNFRNISIDKINILLLGSKTDNNNYFVDKKKYSLKIYKFFFKIS